MACRIIVGNENGVECAVLFCSTTGWAFGPVFHADDERSAHENAKAFIDWLGVNPGMLSHQQLCKSYSNFLKQGANDDEID